MSREIAGEMQKCVRSRMIDLISWHSLYIYSSICSCSWLCGLFLGEDSEQQIGRSSSVHFVVDQQSGMGRSRLCNPGLKKYWGLKTSKVFLNRRMYGHSLSWAKGKRDCWFRKQYELETPLSFGHVNIKVINAFCSFQGLVFDVMA